MQSLPYNFRGRFLLEILWSSVVNFVESSVRRSFELVRTARIAFVFKSFFGEIFYACALDTDYQR